MKKLKKILVIALVVIMLGSVCACGGQGNETQGNGTLKVALGDAPAYLDPAIGGDSYTMSILSNMYFPLFCYDKNGNVINEAVESYEVSEDGLVYTLHLREGNKWSDGKAVTASDYVYGAARSVGYGPDAGYSRFITEHVVGAQDNYGKDVADFEGFGMVATDDKTITITIMTPCPYFVSLLISGVFYPQRSDFAEEHTSAWANDPKVPTNGPFKLSYINESEKAELVKNDQYIYADKVKLDGVNFLFMADQDAQQLAFETGEIDMATNIATSAFTTYKGKSELVVAKPYVINYFILLNPNEIKEVEVRKALALATNRSEFLVALDVNDTAGAYYELYGFVPEGIPGANGDFYTEGAKAEKWLDYDPEAAKAIMEKYGYTEENPLKLTYYYSNSATHTTVAQVIESQWSKVNVDVELKSGDVQTFFKDRGNGNFQACRHANSADYLDPMIYLEMYKSTSQDPVILKDETYDKMLVDANQIFDPKARMELLHEAEEYLVTELCWVIPIYGYANPYLVSSKISGFETDPSGLTLFRYTELAK